MNSKQQISIMNVMLAAMLAGTILLAGCRVEKLPSREQQQQEKDSKLAAKTSVTEIQVPTTDDAALVIAACGPAASDQVVSINDKTENGTVRRMVYSGSHPTTLDFLPLQNNSSASNTVWRFNEAIVDNQKLLTAANIRVYLPCAANALAKEF